MMLLYLFAKTYSLIYGIISNHSLIYINKSTISSDTLQSLNLAERERDTLVVPEPQESLDNLII